VATSVAEAFRTRAEVNIHPKSYPPLINDPELAAFAKETVVAEFGREAFVPLAAPSMTAEDFAFYTMHRPGAFLYVGVNPDASTPYPPLHSNRYVFTDETLPVAARLLASLAWRFLQS
jgi:metal-dependent amidase/aminoacylase/carboxypeptidase family protein